MVYTETDGTGVACTGVGDARRVMADGGTPGTTEISLNVGTSQGLKQLNFQAVTGADVTWNAGVWTVRLWAQTAEMGSIWAECRIRRYNAACALQETLATDTADIGWDTTGQKVRIITANAGTSPAADDVIIVENDFSSTSHSATIGVMPDQDIDTPFTEATSSFQDSAAAAGARGRIATLPRAAHDSKALLAGAGRELARPSASHLSAALVSGAGRILALPQRVKSGAAASGAVGAASTEPSLAALARAAAEGEGRVAARPTISAAAAASAAGRGVSAARPAVDLAAAAHAGGRGASVARAAAHLIGRALAAAAGLVRALAVVIAGAPEFIDVPPKRRFVVNEGQREFRVNEGGRSFTVGGSGRSF